MKIGLKRFTFYLEQIRVLTEIAAGQKNSSLWLYKHDARTPFIMLEGLSKLYSGIHNPKRFGKLKEQFKLIEDGLGHIDYYQSLSRSFANKKQIPAESKQYIKNRLIMHSDQLDTILLETGWLSDNNKRIKKITKKLKEADWLSPGEEVEAFSVFYKSAIRNIEKFVDVTKSHFDNVEQDVHELRRKLRWLSIYPQALQGAMQYADESVPATHLEKYLTEEIINSPFNKLPSLDNNHSLKINKEYFLALSWMIAQLGRYKDEGLLITGLCEALEQAPGCNDEATFNKATELLGSKQRKMKDILNDAEAIALTFFEEKNLQHLIAER